MAPDDLFIGNEKDEPNKMYFADGTQRPKSIAKASSQPEISDNDVVVNTSRSAKSPLVVYVDMPDVAETTTPRGVTYKDLQATAYDREELQKRVFEQTLNREQIQKQIMQNVSGNSQLSDFQNLHVNAALRDETSANNQAATMQNRPAPLTLNDRVLAAKNDPERVFGARGDPHPAPELGINSSQVRALQVSTPAVIAATSAATDLPTQAATPVVSAKADLATKAIKPIALSNIDTAKTAIQVAPMQPVSIFVEAQRPTQVPALAVPPVEIHAAGVMPSETSPYGVVPISETKSEARFTEAAVEEVSEVEDRPTRSAPEKQPSFEEYFKKLREEQPTHSKVSEAPKMRSLRDKIFRKKAQADVLDDDGIEVSSKHTFFVVLRNIAIAVALFAILLQFFSPTVVNEHSMENTLNEKDILYIASKAYWFGEPAYNDIIIFDIVDDDGERKKLVKRVIGLPGDKIMISGGTVFRNGVALEEPYTKDELTSGPIGEVTVPSDSYYALGDNRTVSRDSRSEDIGFIHKDQLSGKVVLRFFPLDKFKFF